MIFGRETKATLSFTFTVQVKSLKLIRSSESTQQKHKLTSIILSESANRTNDRRIWISFCIHLVLKALSATMFFFSSFLSCCRYILRLEEKENVFLVLLFIFSSIFIECARQFCSTFTCYMKQVRITFSLLNNTFQ